MPPAGPRAVACRIDRRKPPNDRVSNPDETVLVFQGGGALGAYQAGVYEGLAEAGIVPTWLAGVSIGAVNAALIAGNPPERRLARLEQFWERVSSRMPLASPVLFDPVRATLNVMSATTTALFGAPGFFVPRRPPPVFGPDGASAILSVYDTTPFRESLEELVDFDLVNSADSVRLSVGAVNVRSGTSIYFDNRERALRPEHVLASGSLPPGFPPTEIDGEHYWDGGLVSNSPLSYVFDAAPLLRALIVQVDLFSAAGALPATLDQVLERAKDIQYASKTRLTTAQVRELEELRHALARLMDKVPEELRDDPDYRALARLAGHRRSITIAHLTSRRLPNSTSTKDFEFSRATVHQLWDAGLEDARRANASRAWLEGREIAKGVRLIELSR